MTLNLDQLAAQLRSPDVATRRSTAEQLAQQGEAAGAVAIALIGAWADDDEATREWLVSALEDCGPPSLDATEELSRIVTHDSLDESYWAATLLGRLGTDASATTPSLEHAQQNSAHATVRRRAAWALDQIRRSG